MRDSWKSEFGVFGMFSSFPNIAPVFYHDYTYKEKISNR